MIISKFLLIAIMVAISLSIAACGGDSEPQHRTLNLEISDSEINLSDEDLRVTQGDTVTMNIASDEHGRFHLHGYDHEISVGPGESAEFTFDATATGRFNFTFHHSEEGNSPPENPNEEHEHEEGEGEEVNLGALEVHPR